MLNKKLTLPKPCQKMRYGQMRLRLNFLATILKCMFGAKITLIITKRASYRRWGMVVAVSCCGAMAGLWTVWNNSHFWPKFFRCLLQSWWWRRISPFNTTMRISKSRCCAQDNWRLWIKRRLNQLLVKVILTFFIFYISPLTDLFVFQLNCTGHIKEKNYLLWSHFFHHKILAF